MKRIFKWAGIIIGVWIVAAVIWAVISGDGGDPAVVAMVKDGKLKACPAHTLGKLADSFMASPRWESIVAEDKKEYVNVTGGITYLDKPVEALVQFSVDRDGGAFTFRAFELNGIPQNKLIQAALIQKMCESVAGK